MERVSVSQLSWLAGSSPAPIRPGRPRARQSSLAPAARQAARQLGVPEVLADQDAERRRPASAARSSRRPGAEEAPLLEDAVGRQVELAVDEAMLAAGEQERAVVEDAAVALLDAAHDDRHRAGGLGAAARPAASAAGWSATRGVRWSSR